MTHAHHFSKKHIRDVGVRVSGSSLQYVARKVVQAATELTVFKHLRHNTHSLVGHNLEDYIRVAS
jgi:hypothetical protein